MKNVFSRGLAAVLALSASSIACAANPPVIQSSVSLSNLSYTVKDLNFFDFKKPTFTASANAQDNVSKLYAGTYTDNGVPSVSFNALPFDSSSRSFSALGTLAAKSGNSLSAQTNLTMADMSSLMKGQTSSIDLATSSSISSTVWTLGAYSQVTIQGTITSSLNLDTAQLFMSGLPPHGTLLADNSYAYSFYSRDTDNNLYYVNGTDGGASAFWGRDGQGYFENRGASNGISSDFPSGSVSKTFTLTAINRSSTPLKLYMDLAGSTRASWYMQPVPEPSTYALMGLGMGLMAWRVRAHRAQKA